MRQTNEQRIPNATSDALHRVPASPEVRAAIRAAAMDVAADANGRPPGREELERCARRALALADADPDYLGFAMVMVSNARWAGPLRAVRPERRLLLLPRCIGRTPCSGGPGACSAGRPEGLGIEAIRERAEQLGYRILVADGTPIVVRLLKEAPFEAVVGSACMDSLIGVFDRVSLLGVPAVAVPLLDGTCRDTETDLQWLAEYVESFDPAATEPTAGPPSLLHRVRDLLTPASLDRRLADVEPSSQGDALDEPARIARDWLAGGGKRLRPLVTLAAADALGRRDESADRVALAIEAFHKASLAHDDVEDDDPARYGRPTLHRRYDAATAINTGDYLLGLGYRLLARVGEEIGAAGAAALFARMSRAHVLLAQGQGAELAWRREGVRSPTPAETLKVYALKTAPAFEAALACGVILGGRDPGAMAELNAYCRDVGVAFQLKNDLAGWREDLAAGRPTYLSAVGDMAQPSSTLLAADVEAVGQRWEAEGVFAKARQLAESLRERARERAAAFEPAALRDLCDALVDWIA